MVLDVLHGPKRSASLCVYYLEEESPVGPYCWLGRDVNALPRAIANSDLGHATL